MGWNTVAIVFTSVKSDFLPMTAHYDPAEEQAITQTAIAPPVLQPSRAELAEARDLFNSMALVSLGCCVFPDEHLHSDIRLIDVWAVAQQSQAQAPLGNQAIPSPGSQLTAQRLQLTDRPEPLERISLSRRSQAASQPPRVTQPAQVPDLASLGVARADLTEDIRSNINSRLANARPMATMPLARVPYDFRAALPPPPVHEAWNRQVRQAVQADPANKTCQEVEGGMLVLMHSVKKNRMICSKECQICREGLDGGEFGDPAGVDQCSHWFHKGCILRWLHQKATCPACRIPVKELLVADQEAVVHSPSNYDSNRNTLTRFETPRRTRDQQDWDTPLGDPQSRPRTVEEIIREHQRRL